LGLYDVGYREVVTMVACLEQSELWM
jgi:hypothetical protein